MTSCEAAARAYLRRTLGFPEQEIDEIIRVGRTALTRALADLERALAGDGPVSLADAAHAVKGVLRNLGLEEAAGLARRVEERAGTDPGQEAHAVVAALRRELGPFLECGALSGDTPGRFMDSAAVKA